jgi:gliding motility-associated-like protein
VLDPGFQPSVSYLWQDGSSNSTYPVSSAGTYAVTVTIGNCSSTSQVQISVDPSPQVFLGNDTVVCKGFPIFLDATNQNASYIWQDGSTNPFVFAEDPGFYSVLVSVGNCIAGDTIYLDQQDKPRVFLGEDSLLCSGQPLILNAFNYGATYTWQDGSTASTFQPGVTGFYFVTAENRCGVAADSIDVTFVTCNCLVYIPSAFSPNRDNKNELFLCKVNCTEFQGKLEIYNRMGQLLFQSQDLEEGWDGTWKGKDAPEGVYIYVLKYSGYDNGRYINERKREPFLLIR